MTDSNDLARVRAALSEALDTGNVLVDLIGSWGANPSIMNDEDMFEFEQALVGIPETVGGVERNMEYYVGILRDAYVEQVLRVLDWQEKHHHG